MVFRRITLIERVAIALGGLGGTSSAKIVGGANVRCHATALHAPAGSDAPSAARPEPRL